MSAQSRMLVVYGDRLNQGVDNIDSNGDCNVLSDCNKIQTLKKA